MNTTDPTAGNLTVGDRAPNFFLADQRDIIISLYDKVKGGPIVVLLYPSATDPSPQRELVALGTALPELLELGAHVFTIGCEAVDAVVSMREHHPLDGAFTAADPDRRTSVKFGIEEHPLLFVLDPNQHVLAQFEPGARPMALLAHELIAELPQAPLHRPGIHAPILLVPHVFSREECRHLISQFWLRGNQESGTHRAQDGVMVHAPNHSTKRRRDHHVGDDDLLELIGGRIGSRVIQEIRRAFQSQVTRVEEFKIVCYEPDPGGYFRVHRDNTSPQTQHRRFAMTLNLNSEEYEGGELRFPEFGGATYKPATGEAAIFSCNLLHEATDVIGGKRYVLLSFLYDEAGQKQRSAYEEAMRGGQRRVTL